MALDPSVQLCPPNGQPIALFDTRSVVRVEPEPNSPMIMALHCPTLARMACVAPMTSSQV
jgi:hypothetical protein